ncbi:hypothetical protein C5167_019059 [Papaver somniferum]|uniref:Uncharacterized protein n=1 Tax=Papaver somniferum TaxID=3469 RepID=A0A4Y7IT00_PAPSO|nr:hypothetical protein C5167_019059 [Papaver somniferum]
MDDNQDQGDTGQVSSSVPVFQILIHKFCWFVVPEQFIRLEGAINFLIVICKKEFGAMKGCIPTQARSYEDVIVSTYYCKICVDSRGSPSPNVCLWTDSSSTCCEIYTNTGVGAPSMSELLRDAQGVKCGVK